MKIFLSLLGGLIIGGLLSFVFLDYQNQDYTIQNYYGIDNHTVKELDFNFMFKATLIIGGVSIMIYLIWTKLFLRNK